MESTGDGWRNELQKYLRSVENLTENSLLLIKRDRIRNNLPFDDSFKKYFLDRTNLRIATVYTNFLYEERLEEEVHHQNYGNGGTSTSIGNQLLSTIIGPESIEQMPIILVQSNNQNLASNTIASATTFILDDNRMSDQIIIPPPSNQSPPVPSEIKIKEDPDQEVCIQSTECIVVEDEPEKKSETTSEALIECKRNEANNSVANEMVGMAVSTSTSAEGLQCGKSFERISSSNIQNQTETIDLTSDQEDLADTLDINRSDKGQTQPNIQRQNVHMAKVVGNSNHKEKNNCLSHRCQQLKCEHCVGQSSEMNILVRPIDRNSEQQSNGDDVELIPANYGEQNQDDGDATATNEKISNKQFSETINSISDQGEAVNHDQSVDNIAGSSQITKQKRNREDDIGMSSGQLKKMSKSSKSTKVLGTDKRHKCDYCEYSTDFKSNLTSHIRTHTNEQPYGCKFCTKRFTQKHVLKRHMKIHRAMFAFQCPKCHQGFADERQRILHQNRCKTKGYECYLCKKVASHKQHLVDHMRAHTGEKLHCSKCRKKFRTNWALTCHMKSHGKLFQFQCSNCRQVFPGEEQWKSHERRCKYKQFECYLCRNKFYQNRLGLLVHIRHKHTSEKPFSCSYCPMRFCNKSNLTRHSKSCH